MPPVEEPPILESAPDEMRAVVSTAPPLPLFRRRGVLIALIGLLLLLITGISGLVSVYVKYARLIDRRLAAGPFSDTLNIYTAPKAVMVGDRITAEDVVSRLRQSGYSTSSRNPMGWYHLRPRAVEIFPGPRSYSGGAPGIIEFSGGKISRIVSLQDNSSRESFLLEPQLITNLSQSREKRRLVRFSEIPQSLIHAVISAEDKRFFQHSGFDFFRLFKAAYVDLKDGRKEQGASTLTMQLARNLWLEPQKLWRRKIEEVLISMHLEHKLTKQQIFEDYANQVYLGRTGSFTVSGFGEAAQAFFGKDLSQITTAEAALLAGLVQRPSWYNPYRHPDRAIERRNIVLALMRDNGYLTGQQYREAHDAPLKVNPEREQYQEDQYFVDLMDRELPNRLDEREKQARYVYTTLDPDLQRAAEDAVRTGMRSVDKQLWKRKKEAPAPAGEPQVALIALDPHTGEIKALVGGRGYAESQFNHVLAMRQPGSVFKPFVYAAALDTAIEGGTDIFTPASILDDEPSSFMFGKTVYSPHNFDQQFMGEVTLRTALAHSLNVATVSLAQQVGYARVVSVARSAGVTDLQPTPSVALGSYDATPLEIAGAYTVFANRGIHVAPTTVALVRGRYGKAIYQHAAEERPALDPRVAYLMVSMMQEVLRSGTGASVWSHGFRQIAAGKTGTSRDGWFAGFTSNLLCVVWVGFDDYRDLKLEGAHSALPIWTAFMNAASKIRGYENTKSFPAPPGIVSAKVCSESGQLATDYCPKTLNEVFIKGTEPVIQCELHDTAPQQFGAPVVSLTSPQTGGAAQPMVQH